MTTCKALLTSVLALVLNSGWSSWDHPEDRAARPYFVQGCWIEPGQDEATRLGRPRIVTDRDERPRIHVISLIGTIDQLRKEGGMRRFDQLKNLILAIAGQPGE